MQRHSKPVAPKHLGIIGAAHFKERFLTAGGAIDTFKYECRKGVTDGIPYVVEFCFGLHQAGRRDRGGRFVPGSYDLLPVPPTQLVSRTRKASASSSRRRRRKPHYVEDVRDSAHRNDPDN